MNKWDQRYSNKQSAGDCCWLLQHQQHLLPVLDTPKRSLDLACGLGANALTLAQLGFESHAWDNSHVAIDKLALFAQQQSLFISCQQRDIEQQPPETNSYDLIVVSQFLHRPLCSAISKALKPNGLLFYQTFHHNKQSNSGPNNADFLLSTNELLHLFCDLQVVYYREDRDIGDLGNGLRDMSYFIAKKPSN